MIDLIEQNKDELFRLCKLHGVRTLELFGSAAEGRFDPAHSDLDFLVTYHDEVGPGIANRFLGLGVDLEELFGRRVDLVFDSAIENPYFRLVVNRSRKPLYAA